MKRFIIISIMAAATVKAFPCAGLPVDNYYLFKVCDKQEFSRHTNQIILDNWKVYLGKNEPYYWFDAEEVTKAAQKKGDVLMVSYVKNLKSYLNCSDQVAAEQWDYPTKAQLEKRKQTLRNVRTYAQGKLRSRLRSQHALLFMRCNMLLGNHKENVTFWEQTAKDYIETIYKDMMRNIYAGALLHTGRADEAAQLFADMGDWNSLMTQYYKRRSFAAIRQEYLKNPNSAVLPFLLQDFVNNSQEAVDDNPYGKLFVRKIQRSEARQMWQFAGQVVSEGKTRVPALWKTAQAWLEYLFGEHRQALADATAAVSMEGTDRMKDNARIILLYITADQQPLSSSYDNHLTQQLQWLKNKSSDQGDDYYSNALHRLVHKVIGPKYAKAGQTVTSLAIYKYADSYTANEMMDTMRVESLIAYHNFILQQPASPIATCLKQHQNVDNNQMKDLIGTKYMRLCQWDKAIEWLTTVPVTYYEKKGYAVYAAKRRYTTEPWIKRQWLKEHEEYSGKNVHLDANPKTAFVREVQRMEKELAVMSGQSRQQRCYDLAVRYAQAHFTGDCWFLMRDSKSISDTVRPNETDLGAKAVRYLREAAATNDFTLKEKALFALSYHYLYPEPWYTREWNDRLRRDVRIPQPKTQQYKALQTLLNFERSNAAHTSTYVSRCDEYRQFQKLN